MEKYAILGKLALPLVDPIDTVNPTGLNLVVVSLTV